MIKINETLEQTKEVVEALVKYGLSLNIAETMTMYFDTNEEDGDINLDDIVNKEEQPELYENLKKRGSADFYTMYPIQEFKNNKELVALYENKLNDKSDFFVHVIKETDGRNIYGILFQAVNEKDYISSFKMIAL